MKERFEVLDVFRGIFSSMVVLYHLSALSATPIVNNQFIYNTDLFVDFFFILSGFVISYNYIQLATKAELKKFVLKRFLRLYPLHFITLAVFIIMELLKGYAAHFVHLNNINNKDNNVYTVITNLFLVNSVNMPGIHNVSWNIPSWSISAEMIAYFAFGTITLAINHYIKAYKILIYILFIGATILALYTLTDSLKLSYTFNYGFLRGIIGFFTGTLCYCAYIGLKGKSKNWSEGVFHILEPLIMITTLIVICYGDELKSYGLLYELMFFLNVLVFSFEKGWLSSVLKKPMMLKQIGKYSYSIYMTHTIILIIFNIVFIRVLKFPPSAYAYLFVINLGIVYWVSAWTYNNIEMRFNKGWPRSEKKHIG